MERESILRRLRGLAAKTTGAGCTEEEALAAAQMLASLMDRYGFDQAAIGSIEREEIKEFALTECGTNIGNLQYVVVAVASYCDVRAWRAEDGFIRFFGREPDGMLAKYLMVAFHHAMVLGWFVYRRSNPGVAKQPHAKKSFELGMMGRLSSRLNTMKAARSAHVDEATGATGQSLVVQRIAEVNEALEAHGVKIRAARRSKARRYAAGAYHAGQAEGDKVNITTGIAA